MGKNKKCWGPCTVGIFEVGNRDYKIVDMDDITGVSYLKNDGSFIFNYCPFCGNKVELK